MFSVDNRDREARIAELKHEIARVEGTLTNLQAELQSLEIAENEPCVHRYSTPAAKIALFRKLFVGRQDAYAVRWTSSKTGKSGWSPAVPGGFYTFDMGDRHLLPISDAVIERHLIGTDERQREFHVSIRCWRTTHVGYWPVISTKATGVRTRVPMRPRAASMEWSRLRLGNLIALPLQGNCRWNGTTVFLDPDAWAVHADQFAFLLTFRAGACQLYAVLR